MLSRLFFVLLVLGSGLSLAAGQQAVQEPYDLLIRNARVLDGTGNPWFRGDVAIAGGRIAAVGRLDRARAVRTIDARGLYLAPGFIDTHSHAGGGLASAELSHGQSLLAQGITTVMVNPDGGGSIDLVRQRESLLEHGLGVNVAQLVPHGSIRRAVMGTEARSASDDEIAAMRERVRQGMSAGGFGLSTGLFYVPGSFSTTAEVIELAKVAAEFGGVHQSHIRDEADYSIGVFASVEEIIHISEAAGLPGIVTHIKCLGPNVWGESERIIERIERARADGIEIWADQYPYDASATSLAAALLPRRASEAMEDELLREDDPAGAQQRVRETIAENLARRGGADRIQFRRYRPDESIEGRTLQEVADERAIDPVDLAIELLDAGRAQIVSFNMHERDIHAFMQQPWTMTASDGGLVPMGEGVPHPRGYGTFPRRIRRYVMEERVTDLPAAIRSMTHLPATVYRLQDRGQIRPGAVADVVIFDLARLNDPATFTDPHQLAEGMVYVLVNGGLAIDDGEFTGELLGEVLRRHLPDDSPP